MNPPLRPLEQRLERIKKKLLALGDLRPGTLSQQYNVCGTAGCRCKADPPQKHGPYHQLSWTRKRKSKTRFVRPAQLAAVQAQVENYDRMQGLLDEWIETAIEISDLKLKEAKNA